MRTARTNTPINNPGRGRASFMQVKGTNGSFFSKIQPKLTIGRPGDKYEVEADNMADKVLQGFQRKENNAPPFFNEVRNTVQSKCNTCAEETVQRKENEEDIEDTALEQDLSRSKGGGTALSSDTRSSMETAFGTNFDAVRIHTGSNAVQMSQNLNAQAFTHGNDVYFNRGKYNPNTSMGQHLLAHELTHVVQQNGLRKRSNPIQKSEDQGEASNTCTLTDRERRSTLRRYRSMENLRQIMAMETTRETNRAQGGRSITNSTGLRTAANNAISRTFVGFLPNRNPFTSNSSDTTIHQPGDYGRTLVSSDQIAYTRIALAALRHISTDLFAVCITSPSDPLLLQFSQSMFQQRNVGMGFVRAYEEARFHGRTTFSGSGGRPRIDLPSRARNLGHRIIHEAMHYYVHENYRRYAESRPEETAMLMEGSAEFLSRHVIHTDNALSHDSNFAISTSAYSNEFIALRDQVISRISFGTFMEAYFNGRTDLLSYAPVNEDELTMQPKLQNNHQYRPQENSNLPALQKSHDTSAAGSDRAPDSASRLSINDITPEAVIQANLGDCYLLAALSSLAATPHGRALIRESIVEQDMFTYQVRFFRNNPDGGDMVPNWYTITHRERQYRSVAPWVRVIEQGYAQMYPSDPMHADPRYGEFAGMAGSTGGTRIGGAARAFSHLTGRHGHMIQISDHRHDQIWTRITNALTSGRHVVAGTSNSLDEESAPAGLHHSHNYSVLEAFERNGERMVRIRNPWGRDPGVVNNHGSFEIPFIQLAENFLQLAISDFPSPNIQGVGNSGNRAQPKSEIGSAATSIQRDYMEPSNISKRIQKQTERSSTARMDFGSFVFTQIPSVDGQEFTYSLLFNLDLFLERNSIEGVTSDQIQSFITESLNRHASGEKTINNRTVNVSWQTNWISDTGRLGVMSGLGSVNSGQAVGVAVYPEEIFAGEGINGAWECINGVHRIMINGDFAFTALNTRGRGRRARQEREGATNLFGNEITHELGHALGLHDGFDTSSVMNHSNANYFRQLHGEQIRQIAINLDADPSILPEWFTA